MTGLRGMPVLVTGGAGFLGSHLVDALVAAGAQVTAFDDLSDGSLENLSAASSQIRFLRGDVRDRAQVFDAVRGQKFVFHLAANADVPRSVREPELDFSVNVDGGFHVLRACIEEGARLVFSSSAAVYGTPRAVPVSEDHPRNPVSPYGAAKSAVEDLGFASAQVHGLQFTAVRIFNTFGERQPRYVMFDLLRKLASDKTRLEVLGTGAQLRSYCHVSDACRLFLAAALSPATLGRAVNLVGADAFTIAQLAERILRILGLERVPVSFTGQSWPGDIPVLSGNGAWAREHLGFVPGLPFDQGMLRLIEWLERTKGWKLRS